jgi:hypothetical protein
MTTAVGVKIGMLALGAGSAGILLESLDSAPHTWPTRPTAHRA